jgi:hypothetical protein
MAVSELTCFYETQKNPDTGITVSEQPDTDGWISNAGKEQPVPYGTIVDVRHRDGSVFFNQRAGGSEGYAINFLFTRPKNDGDIIAYRVVKPEAEVNGNSRTPKKLMLSAGEMVELVRQSQELLFLRGEGDIQAAIYGIDNICSAIEATSELMGRIK